MELKVIKGDITKEEADAIVNAANSSLLGGGGVDGAIHRAAGPELVDACRTVIARIGSCAPGEAVITPAFNLPAEYVIHTVGPVWNGGDKQEPNKLASCYWKSLDLAAAKDLETIAFPNISTGIYHFPKEKAAEVALYTVNEWVQAEPDTSLKEIRFVCFDDENYEIYQRLIDTK
ncbi:O-acetyl-ADP-ribose deacetylase [Listeria ilorinensis]|uniref:O-acetyl-ADP-ribose deacetylase n=1 Tax=Listeria ilorinensis TaxID=2867439 RepID=UPI001EF6381A|nr:O-acetyl-ADP-ribose deacetylase [Listeria ilorinensis]